ncbi:unnamed protein product [Coregonus sp. 'balchen']|nr:unnamed protein product [Coregonus sp. 'balchen']
METCHMPWKSKTASSCNGGLLGDFKVGPDTDQKQLRRPGSKGSGAFFPGGFQFKIGSGGTRAFVLCSVSLSGGFYFGFRSSELPPSSDVRLSEILAHSSSTLDTTAGSCPPGPTDLRSQLEAQCVQG